jgi:hypothetical protein
MDIYQTLPDRGLEQWIADMYEAIPASGPRYFRDVCGKKEVEPYGYFQLAAVARAGRLLHPHLVRCRLEGLKEGLVPNPAE